MSTGGESSGAEPVDTKGDCTAILYKGLEHLWILVSAEDRCISWNQSSVDTIFVFFWISCFLKSLISDFPGGPVT